MKKLLFVLLGALLAAAPLYAQRKPANPAAIDRLEAGVTKSPENPYDLLSRALVPIASVFSPEAKQHALTATLVLEEMTDLPPGLAGSRLELLLQPPYHILLKGIYAGQTATICRVGDSIWITPNTPPFDALANPPGEPPKKKKHKKKEAADGLAPMVLPFPPQQLALLPILFVVKDLGTENGQRILDVKLMPELAKSVGLDQDWSVQLSLTAAGQPTRIKLIGPGWSLTVRVERLEYTKELPEATWQAPESALRLEALQIQQWSNAIERLLETYRPKNEK